MCVLLLFLAFFTPFEVAFLNPRPVSVSFGINRFTDLVFVVDIYLNLHTACPRPGVRKSHPHPRPSLLPLHPPAL